jgi:hypothetical protein
LALFFIVAAAAPGRPGTRSAIEHTWAGEEFFQKSEIILADPSIILPLAAALDRFSHPPMR